MCSVGERKHRFVPAHDSRVVLPVADAARAGSIWELQFQSTVFLESRKPTKAEIVTTTTGLLWPLMPIHRRLNADLFATGT